MDDLDFDEFQKYFEEYMRLRKEREKIAKRFWKKNEELGNTISEIERLQQLLIDRKKEVVRWIEMAQKGGPKIDYGLEKDLIPKRVRFIMNLLESKVRSNDIDLQAAKKVLINFCIIYS